MSNAWKSAVLISIGEPSVETAIGSVQAASWAMIEDWPLDEGPALDRALLACAAVIEGKRKADDARAAFAAAAEEAGILLRS
ncbi:DUF982 domain-containing protein [Rhizobium halophilum]|uniref:DUF982 domain-containing protein n=1 Tax=Rhizobium halophilum TaxID=2846852 RepID=UPI001EFEE35E|nr:DUF982 domain-containing protein [Rhizobium halophilum]MCF6367466.1 DUF982 domain-containing protein [Rhizobium halophilum]